MLVCCGISWSKLAGAKNEVPQGYMMDPNLIGIYTNKSVTSIVMISLFNFMRCISIKSTRIQKELID